VASAALRSCAAGLAAATMGLPLLVGLGLAMAAIYGQAVINDAMVARYVPARLREGVQRALFPRLHRKQACRPLIAFMRARGGFNGRTRHRSRVWGCSVRLCSRVPRGSVRKARTGADPS
jgi:hypothetical protein